MAPAAAAPHVAAAILDAPSSLPLPGGLPRGETVADAVSAYKVVVGLKLATGALVEPDPGLGRPRFDQQRALAFAVGFPGASFTTGSCRTA